MVNEDFEFRLRNMIRDMPYPFSCFPEGLKTVFAIAIMASEDNKRRHGGKKP